LIAEDEEMLAEAIATTVSLEGLETIVVSNGKEALSLARSVRPDLLLLDVMMPGMSGFEICASLKTDPEAAEIPVILITGKATEEDRAVGMAAGATAYVTKPFSPVHLINLVREILVNETLEPHPQRPSIDTMSLDQLTVYARDLKMLWQREREERKALEAAHERLAELDQLKTSFLSTVTHELLTPFASIGWIPAVLQQESKGCGSDFQEDLDKLSTGLAKLHQRIRGVVKFAELVNKRREPHLGYHALDQVIQWAVQPVAAMARSRDVNFRVRVPSDLPRIQIDPDLVGEAALQMAHNAMKFNHPGGHAEVTAHAADDVIIIEVSDTGVGLTSERLKTLGRPFEQSADALRRGEEGLGIGWAFTCYVAEAHGGWTNVRSPGKGQGSTFSLALPLPPEGT
jgi:signal transduction histidine kinase